jgi:hypothetical protein
MLSLYDPFLMAILLIVSKHLVKTTGAEMVTEIFLYLAEENMIKVIPDF